MIITSLNIPDGYKGLKAPKFKKLGGTVYLAGPNGGGKSRVLDYIANGVTESLSVDRFNALSEGLVHALALEEGAEMELRSAEMSPPENDRKGNIRRRLSDSLRDRVRDRQEIEEELEKSRVLTNVEGTLSIVPIPLNDAALSDPQEIPIGRLRTVSGELIARLNFDAILHHGLAAVMQMFRRRYEKNVATQTERDENYERDEEPLRLIELVRVFLGEEIKPSIDFDPMLFGKPITKANLSPGQLILLKVALTIHFQGAHLSDVILLLDEPENYLHPSAALELVHRLKEASQDGQLWIATHSVPLLAQAEPDEIWFVKDSKVRHGGKNAQEVLSSLLGDDDQQAKLAAFMARPAQYAAIQFATKCLVDAPVADTPASDPQTKQIGEILSDARQIRSMPLRVVDYGSGYGRLLTGLEDRGLKLSRTVADDWDFFSYNDARFTRPDIAQKCIDRLEKCFPKTPSRHASSKDELAEMVGRASVDFIVMCNTLHEIDPAEWPELFNFLGDLLKANGKLLIVEDQWLPVGERAHQFGFLVLDEPEIKVLFGVSTDDSTYETIQHPDEKYAGRLKAHRVPASALKKVSEQTRRDCMSLLQHNSFETADHIRREADSSAHAAHRYAFWTQQHFNATCALKWATAN